MGMFGRLFGNSGKKEMAELLPIIERSVSRVEPLLRQSSGYPGSYLKPVTTALEFARSLAARIPDPVEINPESYAKDPFVHALFPSLDFVLDAFGASRAMQGYYREFPATDEVYALMGMRRCEKNMMGMALSGEVIQHDVPQKVIYFTSHTIENPASSEKLARDQVAWSFFDSLVGKVAKRVEAHKQEKQSQLQEKDLLMARLHAADAQARPALEKQLSAMLSSMQAAASSLDLRNYIEDFEIVLLNPEQHLRLDQIAITMDRMGVRRSNGEANVGDAVIFNELTGFDRRDWTVTMVYCNNLRKESFAERLETAYRRLAI